MNVQNSVDPSLKSDASKANRTVLKLAVEWAETAWELTLVPSVVSAAQEKIQALMALQPNEPALDSSGLAV